MRRIAIFSAILSLTLAIKCPALVDIEHGDYRFIEYSGWPKKICHAFYKCHDGYKLDGSSHLFCLNGRWSSEPPTCQGVNCSSLEPPTNGTLEIIGEVPEFMESSIAVFECNTGYQLDGVSALICLSDGQWSHSPPHCMLEDCDLDPIKNTCDDILAADSSSTDGVYTIYSTNSSDSAIEVFCDMTIDDGGWIMIQRRIDGSEDFYRDWQNYVDGFGQKDGEYWLGLETIHELTKGNDYELRVDLEDFDGSRRFAKYSSFMVGEGSDYTLSISGYTGDAGDSLSHHSGSRFSTKDRDQDTWGESCAQEYKGGWWYSSCHGSNLNGLYLKGAHDSYANGVNWKEWHGYHYSLKSSSMKIRRKN